MSRQLTFAAACALLLACSPAHAGDVLLVDRVKQESATPKPARGMNMAEVERRFGAPQSRLEPRGGQKRQWPTIHRWVYADYTVYFERNRVVDVVLNQASPQEAGPKPPVR
ncbi:hypothetical protein CO613_00275 [Lysobacteraceae bacterium NML07-0707]|nr:hypothetical protein CO613_00275 [Xanthomonadaceae bacterium NML07-0707]